MKLILLKVAIFALIASSSYAKRCGKNASTVNGDCFCDNGYYAAIQSDVDTIGCLTKCPGYTTSNNVKTRGIGGVEQCYLCSEQSYRNGPEVEGKVADCTRCPDENSTRGGVLGNYCNSCNEGYYVQTPADETKKTHVACTTCPNNTYPTMFAKSIQECVYCEKGYYMVHKATQTETVQCSKCPANSFTYGISTTDSEYPCYCNDKYAKPLSLENPKCTCMEFFTGDATPESPCVLVQQNSNGYLLMSSISILFFALSF